VEFFAVDMEEEFKATEPLPSVPSLVLEEGIKVKVGRDNLDGDMLLESESAEAEGLVDFDEDMLSVPSFFSGECQYFDTLPCALFDDVSPWDINDCEGGFLKKFSKLACLLADTLASTFPPFFAFLEVDAEAVLSEFVLFIPACC
jgi:hypothetical protein